MACIFDGGNTHSFYEKIADSWKGILLRVRSLVVDDNHFHRECIRFRDRIAKISLEERKIETREME